MRTLHREFFVFVSCLAAILLVSSIAMAQPPPLPNGKCPAGLTLCSGKCYDTTKDPRNCGGCTNACPSNVTGCSNGVCQCPSPFTYCKTSNKCIDVNGSSPTNCGACDKACSSNQMCKQGSCTALPACTGGKTWCASANSCVDTNSDMANCGGCGKSCTAQGGLACCKGFCSFLITDNNNCGRCGNKCTSDKKCQNSTCVYK